MMTARRSAALLCLVVSGCLAHESVGRPPSPAEIERINAYGQANGGLRLEHSGGAHSVCASGSCGGPRPPARFARIVSATARDTVVQAEDGQNWTFRTETIANAHARNPAGGAVGGAIFGASLGLAATATMYARTEWGDSQRTMSEVLKLGAVFTITQAVAWAAMGYFVIGRRYFHFGGYVSCPD